MINGTEHTPKPGPKILPDRRVVPPKATPAGLDIALVILGIDDAGKPHAARFATTDVDLATKAAGLMGFKTLPVTTDDVRALAARLPAGRVFASGRAFAPFARQATFDALAACPGLVTPPRLDGPPKAPKAAGGARKATGEAAGPAKAKAPVVVPPLEWGVIAVGHVVLACEEGEEAWYAARVKEDRGEDLLVLEWAGWPDLPAFVRRRDHLALLPPGLDQA